MKNFKDMLWERMREQGLNYEDLARRVGVTGVYVSKIVQGKVIPADDKIEKLASALSINLETLVLAAHHDKAPDSVKPVFERLRRHHPAEFLAASGFDNFEPALIGHGRAFPVVGLVRAGEFMSSEDSEYPPGVADDYVYSDIKGHNLFAVRVVNDSMEPEFREGDLLIVNPNLEAKNGDFVIAKIPDDNEATFKKLVRHGNIVILRPLNPRYADIVIEQPNRLAIVGKVVERKTLY